MAEMLNSIEASVFSGSSSNVATFPTCLSASTNATVASRVMEAVIGGILPAQCANLQEPFDADKFFTGLRALAAGDSFNPNLARAERYRLLLPVASSEAMIQFLAFQEVNHLLEEHTVSSHPSDTQAAFDALSGSPSDTQAAFDALSGSLSHPSDTQAAFDALSGSLAAPSHPSDTQAAFDALSGSLAALVSPAATASGDQADFGQCAGVEDHLPPIPSVPIRMLPDRPLARLSIPPLGISVDIWSPSVVLGRSSKWNGRGSLWGCGGYEDCDETVQTRGGVSVQRINLDEVLPLANVGLVPALPADLAEFITPVIRTSYYDLITDALEYEAYAAALKDAIVTVSRVHVQLSIMQSFAETEATAEGVYQPPVIPHAMVQPYDGQEVTVLCTPEVNTRGKGAKSYHLERQVEEPSKGPFEWIALNYGARGMYVDGSERSAAVMRTGSILDICGIPLKFDSLDSLSRHVF